MEYTNTIKVLNEFADYLINNYKTELASQGWSGGKLYNSVKKVSVVVGDVSTVTLSLEDYWKYIENGTKPHFPPMDKILEWIMVKPVLPRPNDDGDLPTPRQLAYLIAREISENGTEGTHDLQDAIQEVNAKYRQRIAEALGHDMEFYIRKVIAL